MNGCLDEVWEVVEALPGNAREIWQQAFQKALAEVQGDMERAATMAWQAFKREDPKDKSVRNWQEAKKGVLLVAVYGGTPEWIKLLQNDGIIFNGASCPCLLDRRAFEALIADWEQRDDDLMVLLENYQTSYQPAAGVGWIKEMKYRTDGLWVRVEWMEEGLGYITRKEFAYLALVFILDESNRPVELRQARLTNYLWLNRWEEVLEHLQTRKGSRMESSRRLRLIKDVDKRDLNGRGEDGRVSNQETADKGEGTDKGNQFLDDVKGLLGLEGDVSFEKVKRAIVNLQAQQKNDQRLTREQKKEQVFQESISKTVAEAIKKGLIKPEQRTWAEVYAVRDWQGLQEFLSLAAAASKEKRRLFPYFRSLVRWALAKPQENGSEDRKIGCGYFLR